MNEKDKMKKEMFRFARFGFGILATTLAWGIGMCYLIITLPITKALVICATSLAVFTMGLLVGKEVYGEETK